MHCAKTFRRLHGTRTIAAKAPRRCIPSRKHPLATPSGRALASGSAACLEHLRAIVAGIVSRRPSRRRCCRRLPPLALLGHSVLHPAAANTMAPSEAVVQTVGILGGVILTAMMFPQLWQLWRTRSADDLSHVFLAFYNIGMLLLVFYNLFMELWVFVVACILQLALGVLLQGGKVWADHWQRTERKRQHGRLAKALSFRSGTKLALREFAAGGGGAPFPRLHPAPSHAMQHLLIDARVALAPGSAAANAEQQGGVAASAAADGFADVSSMLEESLADAGLLLQRRGPQGTAERQQLQQRRQQHDKGAGSGEAGEAAADTATAFFQCCDGYVAAVWHGASASLSGGQMKQREGRKW